MVKNEPFELPVQRLARMLAHDVKELLRRLGPAVDDDLRKQLTRSVNSVVLNVSEALGNDRPAMKANFFRIAKGSASECLGGLRILDRPHILTRDSHRTVHRRAVNRSRQILGQLKRLTRRFDPHPPPPRRH